jgi:hypothetical protein
MALLRPDPRKLVALVALAVVVTAALIGASRARRAHAATGLERRSELAREIHVPHASDAIRFDGELTEPSWLASARTGPFLTKEGKQAVPYSDARFVWTNESLRVGLYASDIDIVSAKVAADGPVWDADAFHVVFEKDGVEHELDVAPTCVLTDGERRVGASTDYRWQSLAKLACDSDGTVDVSGDRDEEWVVEMAVPLQSLGLRPEGGERINVRIRRCDVDSKHSPKRCADMGPFALVFDR